MIVLLSDSFVLLSDSLVRCAVLLWVQWVRVRVRVRAVPVCGVSAAKSGTKRVRGWIFRFLGRERL